MKEIFKLTMQRLEETSSIAFIDRDRGQIDRYEQRPAIKFNTALIKVNNPRRENLNPLMQRLIYSIQIRLVSEKLIEQNNLNGAQRLEKALAYYDTVEEIENLFQGLKLGNTDKWRCTGIIDEDRADFDVVRMTFETSIIKEFD